MLACIGGRYAYVCIQHTGQGLFALTHAHVCVRGDGWEAESFIYRCHNMWSLIIVSNSSIWLHRKGGNCYHPSTAEMGAWKSKLTAEGHPVSPQMRRGGEHRFPDSLSHGTVSTSSQSLKTLSLNKAQMYQVYSSYRA